MSTLKGKWEQQVEMKKKMPMHHTVHCTFPFSQSAELHMWNDHKLSFPCIWMSINKVLFLQYTWSCTCIQLQDNLPKWKKRTSCNNHEKVGKMRSNSFSNTSLSITPQSSHPTTPPPPPNCLEYSQLLMCDSRKYPYPPPPPRMVNGNS